MTLETFIAQYGYFAIFLGTFLEGETMLILGGLAAHQGYLSLPGVIATAICAALTSDGLFYNLGRHYGAAALERRPRIAARAERVWRILQRHRVPLLVGFRFLYGLRIASPLAIGAARIPPGLFYPLNALGALLWAGGFGTAAYFFGRAIQLLFGEAKKYEAAIFGAIAAVCILLAIYGALRTRRPPTSG